jgi:hypothetical protein
VAATPVIAKFDVKYGSEALVVPANLQVSIDLMGRLDIDVPGGGKPIVGSINYGSSSADSDKSTVVFLLISADPYPYPTTRSGDPALRVKVEGPASTTGTPPAGQPTPATPPAGKPKPGTPASGYQESMHHPAGQPTPEQQPPGQQTPVQQTPGQQAPSTPTPSTPTPSPGTPAKQFHLEYPLVLLGNGAVSTLADNPTIFTFWNDSQTTVKVSVRVGRESNA